MTSVDGACVCLCAVLLTSVTGIQSLWVWIPHSITLTREACRACLLSFTFPTSQGTWTAHLWDPCRIILHVNIVHAGKLFCRPILWLQTCTLDQHLIKHTQVCLKSNLEQISQDNRIPWTWPRSIRTHVHTVWITAALAQVRLLRVSRRENVSFMSFKVITFFHLH